MSDQLIVVMRGGLVEDPAFATRDGVLGAALNDGLKNGLHFLKVKASVISQQLKVLPSEKKDNDGTLSKIKHVFFS